MKTIATAEILRLKFYLITLSLTMEATQGFLGRIKGITPFGATYRCNFSNKLRELHSLCDFGVDTLQEYLGQHTGQSEEETDAKSPRSRLGNQLVC